MSANPFIVEADRFLFSGSYRGLQIFTLWSPPDGDKKCSKDISTAVTENSSYDGCIHANMFSLVY